MIAFQQLDIAVYKSDDFDVVSCEALALKLHVAPAVNWTYLQHVHMLRYLLYNALRTCISVIAGHGMHHCTFALFARKQTVYPVYACSHTVRLQWIHCNEPVDQIDPILGQSLKRLSGHRAQVRDGSVFVHTLLPLSAMYACSHTVRLQWIH